MFIVMEIKEFNVNGVLEFFEFLVENDGDGDGVLERIY